MEDLSDIRSLPLSSLTMATRRLLSNLMNSTKVLPTEGPIKRHRDWRGLASLVNISTEVEATIWNYNDKTDKVLELWMQSRAGMVGELLDHLMTLDRFDVYDDLIVNIREQQQFVPANQVAVQNNNNKRNQLVPVDDYELITFEDRPGHKHKYHAYVLYADEDKEFVMEMKRFLNSHGFELCMKDNLLPGYASQYPPVAKLISERCSRIVLVYSPEFLQSHDNSFFRDYAQAVSIELNQPRLVPIIYRQCLLPPHLRMYCSLYFNQDIFWDRLVRSLNVTRYLSVGDAAPAASQQHSNSYSDVNIVTASDANTDSDSRYFLPKATVPPSPPNVSLPLSSASLPGSLQSLQMNTTDYLTEPQKKKRSGVRSFFKSLKGKKNKVVVKQFA